MPRNYVKPTLPAPRDNTPIEDGLVQAWKNLFNSELKEASGYGENFTDSRDALFVLGENNQLQPVAATEQALKTNLQASLQGRLFLKPKDSNQLHQVQTHNGQEVTMSLSTPVADLSAMEPQRPSFWKYLLYPFFADEFNHYNQQKELYDKMNTQAMQKTLTDAATGKLVLPKPVEKDQKPKKPAEPRWGKMEPEEFFDLLKEQRSKGIDAMDQLQSGQLKEPAQITNAVLVKLQGDSAESFLTRVYAAKDNDRFLREHQQEYSTMMKNLKSYVAEHNESVQADPVAFAEKGLKPFVKYHFDKVEQERRQNETQLQNEREIRPKENTKVNTLG